jgi:hypothetical protein
MVKTLNIQTQILSDCTLQITIPDDVPHQVIPDLDVRLPYEI